MKTLNITDYDFEDYSISNAEFTKAWFQINENERYDFENHEWSLRDLDGEFIRPLIKSEIKLIEEYSEEMFLNIIAHPLRSFLPKPLPSKLTYLPMFSKWTMIKLENTFKIGCKEKTFEQWDNFFESTEEFYTKRGTDDFKRIHAMYLANKTYYEFLKTN